MGKFNKEYGYKTKKVRNKLTGEFVEVPDDSEITSSENSEVSLEEWKRAPKYGNQIRAFSDLTPEEQTEFLKNGGKVV